MEKLVETEDGDVCDTGSHFARFLEIDTKELEGRGTRTGNEARETGERGCMEEGEKREEKRS